MGHGTVQLQPLKTKFYTGSAQSGYSSRLHVTSLIMEIFFGVCML